MYFDYKRWIWLPINPKITFNNIYTFWYHDGLCNSFLENDKSSSNDWLDVGNYVNLDSNFPFLELVNNIEYIMNFMIQRNAAPEFVHIKNIYFNWIKVQ